LKYKNIIFAHCSRNFIHICIIKAARNKRAAYFYTGTKKALTVITWGSVSQSVLSLCELGKLADGTIQWGLGED